MEEAIVAKAKELFCTYGLKSVSMDDISKLGGVSKKTLYQFFADKNTVVGSVVDDLLKVDACLYKESRATAKDAVCEVLMQSRISATAWAAVKPAFFYELEKFFPQSWQKIEEHKKKVVVPAITRNLKAGLKEKIYREDLDILFITSLRIQQIRTVLLPGEDTSMHTDPVMAMERFTSFYLHGITNERGKNLLSKYKK